MKKIKHWSVMESPHHCTVIHEPGGAVIAHMPTGEPSEREYARLISLAPEMLDVLRHAEIVLDSWEEGSRASPCLVSIRDAISKAEGRTK